MGRVAAVILAAGVSNRKGRFAPTLPLGDQTVIETIVRSVHQAGAEPVMVVTGYQGEILRQLLSRSGVTFLHNQRYYETQMMDSLRLALERLPPETERVLVCPGDIPSVRTDTIQALLDEDGDFVRPCCQGVPGHPVVLSRAVLPTLMEYKGSGGLREAAKAAGVVFTDIQVQDHGTTLDKGTRDEYEALLKYRRQETGAVQPLQLELNISLRAETLFWSQDCAQFLELIQITGSMLCACQCMHMSYSKGWNMINEIEQQLGYPILIRNQGGRRGGGSTLTKEGQHFLSQFQKMQAEIWRTARMCFHRYFL